MSLRTLERQQLEPAIPGAVKGPPWAQFSLPEELGRQWPWLAQRMGKEGGGGKPLAPWGELMKPVDMRDNLNVRLIKLFPNSPLRFEPFCVLVDSHHWPEKSQNHEKRCGRGLAGGMVSH